LAQKQSFWPSYEVVPVVVLSYVFFGMRIVSSLGMYLNKKTKYVAYTTIAAAALNILLNIVFIPKYGMMVAAYTTLIAFIFLYFISYYYGNLSYKIPFENLKISEALIVGILLYLGAAYFNNYSFFVRLIAKFSAIFIYPLILYYLKFYESIELERAKGFYLKWKNPGKWGENLKSISFTGLSPKRN
jgi:O-antigen/teichoic acid export membrane protein